MMDTFKSLFQFWSPEWLMRFLWLYHLSCRTEFVFLSEWAQSLPGLENSDKNKITQIYTVYTCLLSSVVGSGFMSPLQTESSCFHHIKTHRQQMGVVEVAACFFNLSLICVSPAEKRRLMQCDTCCSLVVTASGNLPVSSDCQLSKYWRTNFSDVLMNVYHSLFTATTC